MKQRRIENKWLKIEKTGIVIPQQFREAAKTHNAIYCRKVYMVIFAKLLTFNLFCGILLIR